MSGVSFGAGAEARGRIGNVFLAFTEVKRVISECQRSRKSYIRTITRNVSNQLGESSPYDFHLYFCRLLI